MTPERWPVDVDALRKGDRITVEVMERASGKLRTDPRWGLVVLGIQRAIRRQLQMRGRDWNLRQDRGDLLVCSDEDGAEYSIRTWGAGMGKLTTAHRIGARVDVGALSEETRQRHDRETLRRGSILAMLAAAERRKRLAPGPPGSPEDQPEPNEPKEDDA